MRGEQRPSYTTERSGLQLQSLIEGEEPLEREDFVSTLVNIYSFT